MSTLAEDAAVLQELKQLATETEKTAKEAKDQAKHAEQLFFARMEQESVDSIKVNGTNFVKTATIYGQVQDREEFIKWAQANAPELLETKERSALVNELVRERLDTGEVLPDGLGFYAREYVSQRVG